MGKDTRMPASKATIDNLKVSMLFTLESSYCELYKDMVLMKALEQGTLNNVEELDKGYLDKILRIHSNVCYANMCLCAQCRASLKSELGVEKRYNIRRSVVTAHEIYKYLYGFTGKQTLWLDVEPQFRSKYPSECDCIEKAANAYLTNYAQEADGTLRNVAKHYSNNPEEFFRNMENVSERSVTDRIAALMAFLQPMHNLLVKELKGEVGDLYAKVMSMPMPRQRLEILGIGKQDKVDALQEGIKHYSSIVDGLMNKAATAVKLSKNWNFDITSSEEWGSLIENNIGLHILFIYMDSMITFRAFTWSESFAEQRQNLAYLILSVHEGFKKLYGYNERSRQGSFWNRAIKQVVLKSGDMQLREQVAAMEARLDKLAHSAILNDEDMIDAFTHNGTMKKGDEYAFAVLDYFIQPVRKADMDDLSAFLFLMNDLMRLNLAVMDLEKEQSRAKTDAIFQGYIDKIEEYKAKACDNVDDPESKAKLIEGFDKMAEMLRDLENKMRNY